VVELGAVRVVAHGGRGGVLASSHHIEVRVGAVGGVSGV
jgi:hypothetical protein